MTPGARCQGKEDRRRKSQRPGQSSGIAGMRASPWRRLCRSVLRACGWKGTAQVREDRRKRDRDHLGASRRKGPPRERRWVPIGSRGGKGARRESRIFGTRIRPLQCQEGRHLREGPVPGECTPVSQNLRRMNMTAIRGEVGGGRWREDPIPLDQGSWTRDTIEKSGTGAGR